MIMEGMFWLAILGAVYPYTIFPAILGISVRLFQSSVEDEKAANISKTSRPFSIIIAAHNEEKNIAHKITATLPAVRNSPASEILVVSDHSVDGTVRVAQSIQNSQLRVFESTGTRGKAGATNCAVDLARHEFLVFTDVDTKVPISTYEWIVTCLEDPRVGCVNPEIVFENSDDNTVTHASGLYWKFEMWLRSMETKLNLYATSSGPCMAVKKSLFRQLPPTGDIDFTTPLDVVSQGYLCVHTGVVRAFDVVSSDDRVEFKIRIRMVSKNFSGTLSRWGWWNLCRHPLYSWALLSHKIMRWLMPYFLLVSLLTNIPLAVLKVEYKLTLFAQVLFYGTAALGMYAHRQSRTWPFVKSVYAFALANFAFAVGVFKAVTGRAPASYTPTRQLLGR